MDQKPADTVSAPPAFREGASVALGVIVACAAAGALIAAGAGLMLMLADPEFPGELLAVLAAIGGGTGATLGAWRQSRKRAPSRFAALRQELRSVQAALSAPATPSPAPEKERPVVIENLPPTGSVISDPRGRISSEAARQALLNLDHTTAVRH